MKTTTYLFLLLSAALGGGPAAAATTSYEGTLAASDSVFLFVVTVPAPGTVTVRTFGFGGGVNAAGTPILAGGMDPFLAIFVGTGPEAPIFTDALLNPYGTSLDLSNYPDFAGCPPAGAPMIGGAPECGDVGMSIALPPGDYTVVLSDGQYIANAVFDNGTLGEGFTDLTGGEFCNLVINGVDCPNDTGAFALDITTPDRLPTVPEPAPAALVSTVLLGLVLRCAWRGCARAAAKN